MVLRIECKREPHRSSWLRASFWDHGGSDVNVTAIWILGIYPLALQLGALYEAVAIALGDALQAADVLLAFAVAAAAGAAAAACGALPASAPRVWP